MAGYEALMGSMAPLFLQYIFNPASNPTVSIHVSAAAPTFNLNSNYALQKLPKTFQRANNIPKLHSSVAFVRIRQILIRTIVVCCRNVYHFTVFRLVANKVIILLVIATKLSVCAFICVGYIGDPY